MQPFPPLDVRQEVTAALKAKRPVVGMVSAPIGHTLPWPANVKTIEQVSAVVQEEGALLAVVGVWQGKLTVGLETAELAVLGQGGSQLRASRRDLATAVAKGLTAATTVSASMVLASRSGIRLLVTGAIGGARHNVVGMDNEWEISADLVELSQTPVAVVCAGARTVHNLGNTAGFLETFRVPLIGYQTDWFPSFYMRLGSYPVSVRLDRSEEIAGVLSAHWGMEGAGAVVAQPTPEQVALSPDELLPAIQAVEQQAAEKGESRKDLSPFQMERLNRLTRGKALRAYQAILVANARLAAQIAKALG
jgi:pseudouridine-5'-phosphate glycosidase